MTRIYWTPHKSRQREREFVAWLHAYFGGELLNERFPLAPASLDYLLEKSQLITWLDADRCLALSKRQRCIDVLCDLPSHIRIAMKATNVSFDVVIQQCGHTYYWEFNEQQHRSLTVDRLTSIYMDWTDMSTEFRASFSGSLRDVWRIKAFPNVSIFWDDWFARMSSCSQPSMIHGFREYHLPGKFSFKSFCAQELVR
jgi:hypothetical protein